MTVACIVCYAEVDDNNIEQHESYHAGLSKHFDNIFSRLNELKKRLIW